MADERKKHISINIYQKEHDRIDALVVAFEAMGNATKRATVAASALAAGLDALEAKVKRGKGRARGARA